MVKKVAKAKKAIKVKKIGVDKSAVQDDDDCIQVTTGVNPLPPALTEVKPVLPPVTAQPNKIWNQIKDLQINLFGITSKFVKDYCQLAYETSDTLFLKCKVSAFLPALEELLKTQYTVELSEHFLSVKANEVKVVDKTVGPFLVYKGAFEQ